jgi:hypothetical protein
VVGDVRTFTLALYRRKGDFNLAVLNHHIFKGTFVARLVIGNRSVFLAIIVVSNNRVQRPFSAV